MKYTFDHDFHIHSFLSSCSEDPNQIPENILRYAEKNNLSSICITDHFWDSDVKFDERFNAPDYPNAIEWYSVQNFDHISQSKPLPQSKDIRFMFGCETDYDKFFNVGLAKKNFDLFDFVIIPTTHMHMRNFTVSIEDGATCKGRADLWVKKLDKLLDMDLPFHKIGIAHLTCSLIGGAECNYLEVLELISNDDMARLFKKAAAVGVGIELNQSVLVFNDDEKDIILRPYRIAKEAGCKFYLGSDAHGIAKFDTSKKVFENAIDLLELDESDKFHI